jgi:hypothetical protein
VQPGCEFPNKALIGSIKQNQQKTIDTVKRLLTGI